MTRDTLKLMSGTIRFNKFDWTAETDEQICQEKRSERMIEEQHRAHRFGLLHKLCGWRMLYYDSMNISHVSGWGGSFSRGHIFSVSPIASINIWWKEPHMASNNLEISINKDLFLKELWNTTNYYGQWERPDRSHNLAHITTSSTTQIGKQTGRWCSWGWKQTCYFYKMWGKQEMYEWGQSWCVLSFSNLKGRCRHDEHFSCSRKFWLWDTMRSKFFMRHLYINKKYFKK